MICPYAFCMYPHVCLHISLCLFACFLMHFADKSKPVINIIHHCMQAGTYRFPEPEKTFEKALQILRTNKAAVEWLTDRGKNNVEDSVEYKHFKAALETGMRNVALSGSKLFKKNAIKTKNNWQKKVDKWRKSHIVLSILRYFPCILTYVCIYPYAFLHVSLRMFTYILMHFACILMSRPSSLGTSSNLTTIVISTTSSSKTTFKGFV